MSVKIELQPIFLELDFWPKRPSHKNGTTFQALKWERLIFMKNISVKMFLVCYEDQNECQHHRATTNISRTWFWPKRPSHKNGNTFQAVKWEKLIFTKNVSGKKFLECYKDQNDWQHHRATTIICWTSFFG